jgi:hypothetical protein
MPNISHSPIEKKQPTPHGQGPAAAAGKSPFAAREPQSLGGNGLMSPVQLLALQRSAGNQAVQRMLAKPAARTAQPAQPVIQRMIADDIDVFRMTDPPADQLRQLLKLFTDWENEAQDARSLLMRQKLSVSRLNDFLNDHRYEYLKNQDNMYAYIKSNVYDSLIIEAATMEQPDAYSFFCELVFPTRTFFNEQSFTEAIPIIPDLSFEQQNEVVHRSYDILALRALRHVKHFKKVYDSFPAIAALYSKVVASGSFQSLSDQEQNVHITDLLGDGGQKDAALEKLAGQFPELSLLAPPQSFFDDKTLNKEKVNAIYPGEEFSKLIDIIAKARNTGEMAKALKQLGQFMLATQIKQTEMASIFAALKSIVDLHNPALRKQLYDSLAKLLQKPEQDEPQKQDDASELDSYSDDDIYSDDTTDSEVDAEPINREGLIDDLAKSNEPMRLLRLMLSDVYPHYLTDTNAKGFLDNSKARTAIKNTTNQNKVLNALITLKNREYMSKYAAAIVKQIFKDTKGHEPLAIIDTFATMELLIKLNYVDQLLACQNMNNLKNILDQQMGTTLGLNEEELTQTGLEHLIQKFRNVTDLLTYAGQLRKIKEREQQTQAIAGFKQFVLSVMQDANNAAYQKFRYGEEEDASDSEAWQHLAKVLELPDVREEWKRGATQVVDHEDKKWTVRDTDAPSDMLLLGTDFNTCQSIDNGLYNQCLLSYLIDGKNRAIVIKQQKANTADKDVKMVGRALFKLLLDDEQNVVLYLEKTYVDETQIKKQDADAMLLSMAKQRAREISQYLNIKLLAAESTNFAEGVPSGSDLHSLGGPAPFDYNDTELEGGPPAFTIDSISVVELPY